MATEPITSLEEAARARVAAVAEVEAARVAFEEVRPVYADARDRLAAAERQVKALDQGMGAVARAHAVQVALREQGIETEEPPMVVVPAHFETELPRAVHPRDMATLRRRLLRLRGVKRDRWARAREKRRR